MNSLDVGCGDRPRGTVNIDILDYADFYPKREINVRAIPNFIKASLMYLPFRPKIFETVYCFHVLEHESDLFGAIHELSRVSNRELILVVPNGLHDRIHNRLLIRRGFWARKAHKHAFTVEQLRTALNGNGLSSFTVSVTFKLIEFLRFRAGRLTPRQLFIYLFSGFLDLFPPFPSILIARVDVD